jgi:hypothetical protein
VTLHLPRRQPMASLEKRNLTYRVVFMYGGRKYGYSLDTGAVHVLNRCGGVVGGCRTV